MHCCYMMIKKTKAMQYLDEFDMLCLLFSGLMHDINHTGKTNGFESSSFSNFAIQYNDVSILEQHHAATTFKLIKNKHYNIFDKLSYTKLKELRKRTIHNILATDMKKHQDETKAFE